MYLNYPVVLNSTKAEAEDISVMLVLGEFYVIQDKSLEDFCFKVTTKVSQSEIGIEWQQLDGIGKLLEPATLPLTVSVLSRGFSSLDTSVYKLNYLRRGYFDIDEIVFDIFFKKITKWIWTSGSHSGQPVEDLTKLVDFFFFNKRPITRQPYAERTLGATDNVDSSWQTSKDRSNPASIKTMPYLVFQPLDVTPTPEELHRVEEFYRYMNSVPQAQLDLYYEGIEVYQPPQLYEFSYQVTAVTDNWRDCRVLQSHLINGVIPTDCGERYIVFPSGISHTVTIEPSQVVGVEDSGVFETTVTYVFKLPLIDRYPELTYSWVTGAVGVDSLSPYYFQG